MLRAAYIWYLRINLNPFIAGTDFRNYDLKITHICLIREQRFENVDVKIYISFPIMYAYGIVGKARWPDLSISHLIKPSL